MITSRDGNARPVVRKNSTAPKGKESRNFTHPVIFLSLNRLQPISTREYDASPYPYLDNNKTKFIVLCNELLNRSSILATGTSGIIQSAVAHNEHYDHLSASAGEDNAGQIILALMSFRKLKEEYPNYKGGLLLIDEADAGLFPGAQLKMLDIFERECKNLDIQVVMTSHSPTLIQKVFEKSQTYRKNYKTVYLSDTSTAIRAQHNYSWKDIDADLLLKTLEPSNAISTSKVNVYFEDAEAAEFFKYLLFRHPINKFLNTLNDVSLGCSNYIQLVQRRVPEFSTKSIIILDGDVKKSEKLKSIILLPGELPPDQLIFEFLYNLPPSDEFWNNPIKFSRAVFLNCSSEIISTLLITDSTINLKTYTDNYHNKKEIEKDKKDTLREIFKKFYNHHEFQKALKQSGLKNPWKRWMQDNVNSCEKFRGNVNNLLMKILPENPRINEKSLTKLNIKNK